MTSKEIIALEDSNTGCINLYKEGLFWRAYERSAYALCTRVHPFKAMKRQLKVLGGMMPARRKMCCPVSGKGRYDRKSAVPHRDNACTQENAMSHIGTTLKQQKKCRPASGQRFCDRKSMVPYLSYQIITPNIQDNGKNQEHVTSSAPRGRGLRFSETRRR